jgi:hypothetical protein
MAEPSLISLFGASATQSSTLLTLTKADFATLTASSSNTAESLLVALLLKWQSILTSTAQSTNPDQSVRVEKGSESIVTDFNQNNAQYVEVPFTITLRKAYTALTIDPDDF